MRFDQSLPPFLRLQVHRVRSSAQRARKTQAFNGVPVGILQEQTSNGGVEVSSMVPSEMNPCLFTEYLAAVTKLGRKMEPSQLFPLSYQVC